MKRLTQALTLAVLAFLAPAVIATSQAPDIIIIDGQSEALNTNPLRAFLQNHPNTLPESDFQSSGNWRGYVATWEVSEDTLFLTRVDVDFEDSAASAENHSSVTLNVIDKLFPGAERVGATWYSGALIVPRGEIVKYVHMGYGSTYERYTILAVKNGRIAKRLDLSADEFEAYRIAQFARFKNTRGYAALLKDTMSKDSYYTRKRAEEFLFQFESENYLSTDYDQAH